MADKKWGPTALSEIFDKSYITNYVEMVWHQRYFKPTIKSGPLDRFWMNSLLFLYNINKYYTGMKDGLRL